MADLNMDNVLSEDEINTLFTMPQEENQDTSPEDKKDGEDIENNNDDNDDDETTEVDVDTLFTSSESVGSGKTGGEDTEPSKGSNTSSNFYSSIASALKAEGIFPDLDDDIINKVQKPEDFRDLIDKQIKAGLDERQKRVNEALDNGVEPDVVKQYENIINYVDGLTDDALSAENTEGETLRKNLIYTDYVNRGFSDERARKEVEKSLRSGNDIEDAKEALVGLREFYKSKYSEILEGKKKEVENFRKAEENKASNLRKSILEDEKVYGDFQIDKLTRQKIYDNLTKPVHKTKDGKLLTAIQKYQSENNEEFMKNLGLVFTLTDGFTNFEGLVGKKVKKEVSQGLRNLEKVLNSTMVDTNGNLRFAGSSNGDSLEAKDYVFDV